MSASARANGRRCSVKTQQAVHTGTLLALCVLLTLSACGKATPAPTATPDRGSVELARTLFAPPTHPPRVTPTPSPADDVELALSRTTAAMEQAVRAADMKAYWQWLWPNDPVFLADQRGWATDWVAHPLAVFEIDLFGVRQLSDDRAVARMTTRWRLAEQDGDGTAGGATISAIFYRNGERWLFGGERWQVVELEGMRLYYFADEAVDESEQAQIMLDYLPAVYIGITRLFGYTPAHVAHIKLYESPITLHNWTRISRPTLTRWNVPGESVKVALTDRLTPPYEPEMGRELALFVLYDMAAERAEALPWWLEAGVGEYGAAHFRTYSQRHRVLREVTARAHAPVGAGDALLPWDALFTPPVDTLAQTQATQQAYTLLHYITETHGDEARNAWLRAIAEGASVNEATRAQLGEGFSALDADWRAWLLAQR